MRYMILDVHNDLTQQSEQYTLTIDINTDVIDIRLSNEVEIMVPDAHLSSDQQQQQQQQSTQIQSKSLSSTQKSQSAVLLGLKLSQSKFMMLKQDQNLLITFQEFPYRVAELFGNPGFSIHLTADTAAPSLQIVESNGFRNIIHLSLQLQHASMQEMIDYLNGLMASYKRKVISLLDQVKAMRSTVNDNKVQMSKIQNELDQYKNNVLGKEQELYRKYNEMIEKMRRDYEHEKSLLVKNHQNAMDTLKEDTGRQIERLNFELNELNQRHESAEQDRKNDLHMIKQKYSELNLEHSSLRSKYKSVVNENEYLQSRLKSFEKDFTQKDTLSMKVQDDNYKLKNNLDIMKGEVTKANDIIGKMSSEIKQLKSKLKTKNLVAVEQEKVVVAKEDQLKQLNEKFIDMQKEIDTQKAELYRIRQENTDYDRQLSLKQKLIEENNQVIEYLHKQLNERGQQSLGNVNNVAAPSSFNKMPQSGSSQSLQNKDENARDGSNLPSRPMAKSNSNLPGTSASSVGNLGRRSNYFK
ncbi:hypothetical protein MP228_001484 [Amoeboaphelidium protococcarum]|nr:hypothetical protein MP228_001484 [Amoeboaphelidium protococcarum]